jgi:hypothetical protein
MVRCRPQCGEGRLAHGANRHQGPTTATVTLVSSGAASKPPTPPGCDGYSVRGGIGVDALFAQPIQLGDACSRRFKRIGHEVITRRMDLAGPGSLYSTAKMVEVLTPSVRVTPGSVRRGNGPSGPPSVDSIEMRRPRVSLGAPAICRSPARRIHLGYRDARAQEMRSERSESSSSSSSELSQDLSSMSRMRPSTRKPAVAWSPRSRRSR